VIELPKGLIYRIVRDAGHDLVVRNGKAAMKCPIHEDTRASAFVSEDNVFFCSVCTPDGGWGAKRLCEQLGLRWEGYLDRDSRPQPRPAPVASKLPAFEAEDAERTWLIACTRAGDDEAVEEDRRFYDYLSRRRLMPAWELRAFGLLPDHRDLHASIWHWRRRGYGIVAPLFDQQGNVTSVQSRGLDGCEPKTLVPAGTRLSGTAFADSRGRQVLFGETQADKVVFGEGLTDMLALAIASPFPVITSPGTSNAIAACGPWANGRRILLALDNDVAGDRAVQPVSAELYRHGAASVLRIRWPSGAKDACDVLERHGSEALEGFLRRQPTARVG